MKNDNRIRIHHLTELLRTYAQNDHQRQVLEDLAKEAEAAGGEEEVIKTLSGALHEGLVYGNWPWFWTRFYANPDYPTRG